MKGMFVVLDGVADNSCSVLNGKTPLEFAKTPNLDEIASFSKIHHCYTVGEGLAPESSSAVLSLLGYPSGAAARGILEAVGAGIPLKDGDLALRVNFATIDDLKDGNILDPRAGRTLSTKEAKILADAVNRNLKMPYKFELYPTVQHRGVLVFRGGFSDNVSNANPFYGEGIAKAVINPKMVYSQALDEEDDSKLSAELINNFIRKSHEILDKHPINVMRAKKGFYAANIILCRDAGNSPAKLKKIRGKWVALGYMPLEKGIARMTGMEVYKFKYPEFKGIDAYEHLYSGLRKAIKAAIRMIKSNGKRCDYLYIHIKETDIPGHDNKPLEKVRMIELIDKKLFSFVKKFIKKYPSKLIVTADHTTSCKLKGHTADAVPVLVYHPNSSESLPKRFIESEGMRGKKILGKKLLETEMFEK